MKLLAVDGNSILNRAYYGIRQFSTKDGVFTNGIYGFLNTLIKIEEELDPDAVAIAFDMRGPTFRHEKYNDYKGTRSGMPDELAMQMPLLQELLGYLGYTIIKKEGWEADDILGTLSKSCSDDNKECVIATGDKDSFQLVNNDVTIRLSYTQGGQPQFDFIDEAVIIEKYGVTPKQLIDVKGFMGDTSDNIPGVKGIGEKTALGLVSKYSSMDYIYDHIDEIEVTRGVRQKLVDGKEMALLSRELGTISLEAPIDSDFATYTKKPVDMSAAYNLMSRLELFNHMKKLEITVIDDVSAIFEPKPAVKIITNTFDSKILTESKPLNLLFTFEGYNITEICILHGNVCYLINENVLELSKEILTSAVPKRTNLLKSLWHFAFSNGFELSNIVFDAEIAAYILNPTSNDYSMERLFTEYAIAAPAILDNPDENPLLSDIIAFPLLCDELEAQIKLNKQDELLNDIELPLAEVLADMEHVGIELDSNGLEEYGNAIETRLAASREKIYELAGEEFNINSPKQLSVILFENMGLRHGKKTKTGYSTNADVLDNLKNDHPIILEILEHRMLAKLKSTYVDGLLAVVCEDGRIHTTFQQTLTRTGRISSTEPNLQNIPVRTDLGSEIRGFFKAKNGYTLLDADYSQIELRVLADLADDQHMKEAFELDEDIHTKTAGQVFDLPPELVTPLMRSRAKAVNFGIVYGIGAFSLSQDIGVSVEDADKYIKNYLSFFSGINKYMEDVIAFGQENGYVLTKFNRRRYLPELAASNHNMREFGKRVARNTPIQGTAADIIKIAMIKVYNRLAEEKLESKLILQVHDELIVETLPNETPQVKAILKEEMENAAKLSVPLVADVNIGKNWLAAK